MFQQTGKRLSLAVLLVALSIFTGALGQETTAGIQGVVKDPSGGTVANATVEISGSALLGTRRVQTDETGNYRITALPPGTYAMVVTASGFRTSHLEGIELLVG